MLVRFPFKRYTSLYPIHTFCLSVFLCLSEIHGLLSLIHTHFNTQIHCLCVLVISHSSSILLKALFPPMQANSKRKREKESCRTIIEGLRGKVPRSGTVPNHLLWHLPWNGQLWFLPQMQNWRQKEDYVQSDFTFWNYHNYESTALHSDIGRHQAKCWMDRMITCNGHNCIKQALLLVSLYHWGNWSSEIDTETK